MDVDNTAEHRARLTVVERSQEDLKIQFTSLSSDVRNQIGTLSVEMRQSNAALNESIQQFIGSQAAAPRPIPFKEIIGTALACLVFFSGIIAFIDSRITTAIDIAKSKEIGAQAVESYRLNELEKQIKPTVQFVRPVQ